jgi:hypothetical protein
MGNKNNKQRAREGTKRRLEVKVARRLSTRDRQHKCRATKREQIAECLQTSVNANNPHIGDIKRSTSRLANKIGPMLLKLISMKGFVFQKLTIEKLLKQPIRNK